LDNCANPVIVVMITAAMADNEYLIISRKFC